MPMGSSPSALSALPGLTLKAWCLVDSAGTLLKGSNVASTVKNSAGNFTVTFTSALSSANYAVLNNLDPGGPSGTVLGFNTSGKTAAAYTCQVCVSGSVPTEPRYPLYMAAYE